MVAMWVHFYNLPAILKDVTFSTLSSFLFLNTLFIDCWKIPVFLKNRVLSAKHLIAATNQPNL